MVPTQAASPTPKIAPCPRGHFLWGIAPEFVRDPLGMLTQLGQLGDVVKLRFGVGSAYLLSNPDHIRHVLQNPKQFNKQIPSYRRLRELVGTGLIVSEGDFWLRQRRIEQPAFHKQRIAGFADAMVQAAQGCVDRLAAAATRGETVDVPAEMTRLTMQVVCDTLLGPDARAEAERATHAFAELNELITQRILALMPPPLWIPTAENRRIRACIAQLDDVIYKMIARRRAAQVESNDLLSMLLHARDSETGAGMTDLQLRDELATLLLAGSETTAMALTWTLYLLSQNPTATTRLQDELRTALAGRVPTLADLDKLPYTRMVIEESMRLYPPVYCTTRGIHSDEDLDGYHLPKGAMVFVSAWVVHRLPQLWPDPLVFRPERFTPGAREALPKGAYFPFIAGPRQCIGNTFAMMEAQLVLSTLASRIQLTLPADHPPVQPAPLVTLRPKNGLRMRPAPIAS